MKTTIDLQDQLLGEPKPANSYVLPDLRAGNPDARNPLDAFAWPELRATIYNEPDSAN